MTDEAPTPDEVDTMMSDIGSLVRVPFQVSRGLQTAKKLRAHITALEAENKRLVDYSRMLVTISIQALERLSINPTTRTSYLIKRLDTAINGMQIVLAQMGEK